MYQEYPSDLVVATTVGAVKVSITDGRHAFIESNDVLISGKPICVALHIFLKNGEWTDKGENGRSTIYAKKSHVMSIMSHEATPTQKEKIIGVVVPTVGKFLTANQHLLKEAQSAHVANRVESIQGYIADKMAEIKVHEAEIATLKATL